MALISCKNLTLGYDGNVLVDNLSFDVEPDDYLTIVGENGAGKSTLMRTILGLQSPMSGSVEFGEGLVKNEIGYLPQQTPAQKDFPASVWEVVISGCQGKMGLRPFYNAAEKERAMLNIKRMEIENLTKKCYRDLSGGQKQRVMLARALCATERLLFLDEPVAGLDPKVTIEMYSLIKRLNSEGIAIIMISHDIKAAVDYSSHILHIGEEVFFGTKDEFVQGSIYGTFRPSDKDTVEKSGTAGSGDNAAETAGNDNTKKEGKADA